MLTPPAGFFAPALRQWLWRLTPGLLLSALVAVAALSLSGQYGAPVMLLALLAGMALNFLSQEPRSAPGIDFASSQVLRLGVALLGLRIGVGQVQALGWQTVAMVLLAVALTIGCGVVLARCLGFQMFFGLLTGGAVAICGASAALALSAALPAHPRKAQATLLTVVGVSLLSTLAMLLYPLLTQWLAFDARSAGFFIGGTIHDVAQVLGAGYSLSREAGDAATLVKLLRVATLLPVIALAAWLTRRRRVAQGEAASGQRPPLLPWFALAFALLLALNGLGWLPQPLVQAGQSASQYCLIVAMAAIGMKTQPREILQLGWRPVLLMLLETLFLALLFCGLLKYGGA